MTEWDGVSVNVGYLLLYRMFAWCTAGSVATFAVGLWVMWASKDAQYPFKDVAWLISAIWGTYAASIGATAAFLGQDAKKAPPGTEMSSSSSMKVGG